MVPNFTFTQQEIDEGKTMAGVAYITWIGWLIAYLTGKDNRFTLYHCQQSLVNCICMFIPLVNLGALVLAVIGALNGFGGKVVPLPVIGALGFKMGLLKPDQPAA